MGFKELQIKIPPGYENDELREKIAKEIGSSEYSYQIIHKSLDARKKHHIFWLIRVGVVSKAIKGSTPSIGPKLEIPYHKRDQNGRL